MFLWTTFVLVYFSVETLSLCCYFLLFNYNKYFMFRSGLTNAINSYLRLKSCIVCRAIFNLNCVWIEFIIQNLSMIYFCISKIFNLSFKTRFWLQNKPCKFVSVCYRILKGYFIVKHWCLMLVLKLSGVQIQFCYLKYWGHQG